jgi:hypothetical protein
MIWARSGADLLRVRVCLSVRQEMVKVLRGVQKGSEYRKELDQAILESA